MDVGKSELTLCLVWPDREFERPWRVKSPGQIRLAILKLLELKRGCQVTVAMESSGTYGNAFGQGLDDAGLAVHRVSDKAVKDDSEGIEPHRAFQRDVYGQTQAEQARAEAAEEVVVFFIIALDARAIGEGLAGEQETP